MELELDDFEEINDNIKEPQGQVAEANNDSEAGSLLYSIYSFNTLSDVISVAEILAPSYKGDSSVYKSPFDNRYYLSLCVDGSEEGIINRTCAVLTENGRRETPTYVKELFFAEHFDEIIADNAIEKLGQL